MPDTPDLSSLPRDVRVRIAVAETQGATWERSPDQGWWLGYGAPVHGIRGVFWVPDIGTVGAINLPDYPTNHAVWAPLMEQELVRWETGEWGDEREHRCGYISNDGVSIAWGRWQPTLGAAVVQAILEKHGVEID